MVRNQNLNYSQIGGGNASLPFNQPGLAGGFRTTAQVNTARPLGRVKYDSLQASMNRRMTNGLGMTAAYTYANATDWWAGGILIPEYWDLNKGTQGGNTPAQGRHLGDLRAAVRRRPEVRQQRRRAQHDPERLAGEHVFHRVHGLAVHRVREQPRRSTRTARSVADQVKSDVEITRRRRRGECLLVRPNSLQAGHRGAFRDGGFQHDAWTELREPRSERVPHVPGEAVDDRPVPAGDLQPDEHGALPESRAAPTFRTSRTTPTAPSGRSMDSAPSRARTTSAASMTSGTCGSACGSASKQRRRYGVGAGRACASSPAVTAKEDCVKTLLSVVACPWRCHLQRPTRRKRAGRLSATCSTSRVGRCPASP